jgi:hypothetical protein
MASATCSPAGARRSAVTAEVTRAIARRSMSPRTKRITVKLAQRQLQWKPRRRPRRQAVRASARDGMSSADASRQQAR